MNSKEQEYILTIARERSLSRAAEKLFITQPALSLFLSRLEEQLQVRLFERTSRGLTLTYAGERYVAFKPGEVTPEEANQIGREL